VVNYLALLSYNDVYTLIHGEAPRILASARPQRLGWEIVLVTYLAGVLLGFGGAAVLRHLGARQFDAAVGRPRRRAQTLAHTPRPDDRILVHASRANAVPG
jgi:hypothetical protein